MVLFSVYPIFVIKNKNNVPQKKKKKKKEALSYHIFYGVYYFIFGVVLINLKTKFTKKIISRLF